MRHADFRQFLAVLALGTAIIAPLEIAGATPQDDDFQRNFDSVFARAGQTPAPQPLLPAARPAPHVETAPATQSDDADSLAAPVAPRFVAAQASALQSAPYAGPYPGAPPEPADVDPFAQRLRAIAEGSHGRIGVAALDLTSGRSVEVRGEEPFPLASTGKVAIVATFLAGVDDGRYRLDSLYPMMYPLPSHKLEGASAPARRGELLSARELIERALTLSDNHAADGLLYAVGGPQAVDRWLHGIGLYGMRLDHNINTLVRDDGLINPATTIDVHDSTTPDAMVRLLAGLYRNAWLSPDSREVLFGALGRCRTGIHRMKLLLPADAMIGHKTGTLANTSSDVGLIHTASGQTIALAIYVTGQGSKPGREARIAAIARAVYNGYAPPATQWAGVASLR
ncbi:MAG: serine hydrolase [Sphingomonadales bacterium]|nr:serine hydrolase [Sphingomonadales bacterium]